MDDEMKQIENQLRLSNKVGLRNVRITQSHIQFLCSLQTESIESLNLVDKQIADCYLEHFTKADWSSLQDLQLYRNCLTAKGCKIISKVHFPALKSLNMAINNISDSGTVHLNKAKWDLSELALSIKAKNSNRFQIDFMRHIGKGRFVRLSTYYQNHFTHGKNAEYSAVLYVVLWQFPVRALQLGTLPESEVTRILKLHKRKYQ